MPAAEAEELPHVPIKGLPARSEQWLESRRLALPAPANRLIDQIGIRLEGLAPCVQQLDEREPAALEVRRLVGQLGFEPAGVRQTTDRHWTWAARNHALV